MKTIIAGLLFSALVLSGCGENGQQAQTTNKQSETSTTTVSTSSSEKTVETSQVVSSAENTAQSSTVQSESAQQQHPNLDENGVLIKYPYTLDYNDATYKILSAQRGTGSMTGQPILYLEMEFTNKGATPTSPYMSFILNFDAQQTDGTTTDTLMGANAEMSNVENQDAVKMGDSQVNGGATVKAIIGYTLKYGDKPVLFLERASQITGKNTGFIIN